MNCWRRLKKLGLVAMILGFWLETAFASGPVKVAILDSGCNTTYREGISLIDSTVRDLNSHGTLIAEIIREVYPEVEIYIIKVIDRDGFAVDEETVILGLEWAIQRKVNLINMSLRLKESSRLHEVIRKAYESGIVIVAAAGNHPNESTLLSTQEALFSSADGIAYPAKYSEVIAVGALDRYGNAYERSAKGEGVDIFCKGYKGKRAGTSIASAYATGSVAKLISENPRLTVEEIRSLLPTLIRVNK